ncbi:MAG: O-acetyl-ADP-ribose deacetylase [Deltaproteobacteria bacterium]|nr:O-acetyl-ADP-ribose deacetylase [Deltaproteobacteria bacterium]
MDYRINKSIIQLFQGDITRLQVDAIVNAANSRLAGGGGVDGAIHRAGGPAIMAECRNIGVCPTGEAVITTGGYLAAKYVIHTVGPVYRGGSSGEQKLLENAYANSLKLAEKHGLKSLAFPSISTGVYGYPIQEASKIAIRAVVEHVKGQTIIEKVVFVLFSAPDLEVYIKNLQLFCP